MKKRRELTEEEQDWAKRLQRIWLSKKRELKLSQEAAAQQLGFNQSAFSQYINGRIPLNTDAKFAFADLLQVPVAEIDPELDAVRILRTPGQRHFIPLSDLPSNELANPNNIAPGPRITGRVPLISWVQAGHWTEVVDVFQPEDAEDWIISAFNHSDTAFALRVQGISMEPEFRNGEIIIVDPTRHADPGKFVIAKKTGTNESTFKQLIQEGGEYFLKAINPDWPEKIIRMNEEWQVGGVVIGKTKAY